MFDHPAYHRKSSFSRAVYRSEPDPCHHPGKPVFVFFTEGAERNKHQALTQVRVRQLIQFLFPQLGKAGYTRPHQPGGSALTTPK